MQLNIRMEDPEERTSELEHKTIEMTPLEEQRKNRKKKMNRASRTCDIVTHYLIFISLESQKVKKKSVEVKHT